MNALIPPEDSDGPLRAARQVVLEAAGDELGSWLLRCLDDGDEVWLNSDGSWTVQPRLPY
jgi:hypothetical protein